MCECLIASELTGLKLEEALTMFLLGKVRVFAFLLIQLYIEILLGVWSCG